MGRKSKYAVGDVTSGREILSFDGTAKHGSLLWTIRCVKCQHVSSKVTSSNLTRSKTCNVCSRSKPKSYKELNARWLYMYSKDAAKRKIEWGVSPEYLWATWLSQSGKCWYTGTDLVLWTHSDVGTASLDRTDSSLGYIQGNVRWVSKNVNRMKSILSEKDFLQVCKQVVLYNNL